MANIKKFFLKISKNQHGLSLSELIITIGVVGTIGTLASAKIDDALPLARDAQRKANIHQIRTALNIYYDDMLEYPISSTIEPSLTGWAEMKQKLEGPDKIYMPEVPNDPLNSGDYVFKYRSDGQSFKITYETEDTGDNSPITVWGL